MPGGFAALGSNSHSRLFPALARGLAMTKEGSSGGETGKTGRLEYSWSQTDRDVFVVVPVDEELRARDVKYSHMPTRISLAIPQGTVFENDQLFYRTVPEDSFWEIDDDKEQKKVLRLQLAKDEPGTRWGNLLGGMEIPPDTVVTDQCFMRVSAGGKALGEIILGLYGRTTPRTAANFKALCLGTEYGEDGQPLHYLGSPFHRIIPGFMCQGGDFTNGDGTGGRSIYGGEKFEDENFQVKHDRPWLLSMANSGPDSNGSQFFITFGPTPHLDGRHVVFGEVIDGMDVVKQLEELGTASGATTKEIKITACGVLPEMNVSLREPK